MASKTTADRTWGLLLIAITLLCSINTSLTTWLLLTSVDLRERVARVETRIDMATLGTVTP